MIVKYSYISIVHSNDYPIPRVALFPVVTFVVTQVDPGSNPGQDRKIILLFIAFLKFSGNFKYFLL